MNKRSLLTFLFALGFILKGFSQFIYPPVLQCVENDVANGNVILSWSLPNNSCGAFNQYIIYASTTPAGPFNQLTVITNQAQTTYTYVNALASSPNWYFYLKSDYNCPGSTALSSDTVQNTAPITPEILSVTVTPDNKVVFTWAPSVSPQASYYYTYYFNSNGTVIPFDTVYGRLNTTLVDSVADPSIQSLSYTVAAIDSCGKVSAYNTAPQNTIYLTTSATVCQKQIDLSWNGYINWPQGVKSYQIWVSKNAAPFALGGETAGNALTFLYTDFNDDDSLQIYIRAVSAADTTIISNSNVWRTRAVVVQPPAYIYLTNLTVTNDNHVEMTWTVDTIAQLLAYKIQNGGALTNVLVEQIPVPVPLQHFETYKDSINAHPESSYYLYKVVAYDSCQNTYPTDSGKTIYLEGKLYDYYIARVKWNDFVLPYSTVLYYNLHRDMGAGDEIIRKFEPGVNLFYDSLQQFLDDKGTFCYRIEAVYDINLPAPSGYHDTLSSFSNTVCVIHRPIIYVPNAFAPGSTQTENAIFKPTIIYGAPQNYSMIIFNRWGGKVFETTDPNAGWDGTDHGKEVQLGGYAYLIQFKADDGASIERKGIVLLVR